MKTPGGTYFLVALLVLASLAGCRNKDMQLEARKVSIRKSGDKYTLYRDGKPFHMKGASGDSHFALLKASGGNTMRLWDTTRLEAVLDSANTHHIALIVGLPIRHSEDLAFYGNPSLVKAQLEAFRKLVNKHKDNPAILMWCVGNELTFPHRPSYFPFYSAFNDLTDMIHHDDPHHPLTTTVLNFDKKHIANLKLRCDVDVISFNIFGRLPHLRQDLQEFSWLWSGPYMLLEWGINGPWAGTEQTAWSAYIEDTSWKKAEILRETYHQFMPTEDPRFLGASVFFWGNKQETTQTWFSFFDDEGAVSEVTSTMQSLWTGNPSKTTYPEIEYMLLNNKGARDDIFLNAGEITDARILLPETGGNFSKIKWEVYREDWYKKNNENSTTKLVPLPNTVQSDGGLLATVTAPTDEGPYRIFATVYGDNGTFATCNTPFYVVGR